MKTITIEGVIGWDVSAADVRAQIKEAKGEDLRIEINSPGGMVTEGIAIYNAIKNAPGVKESLITGLAASMGSYIALAADKVTAEANAIYMVHNAQGFAMGDHNAIRKTADIIEGMSKILSSAYTKKTGKTSDEIRAMMDAETFLYGAEIKEAGFADEIIGEQIDEKESAILQTRAAVASAEDLIKRLSTDRDTDQAAAMLAEYAPKEKPVAVGNVQAAGPEKKKEVSKMTPEELAALQAKAMQDGITAERKRMADLDQYQGKFGAAVDAIVAEAKVSGKNLEDIKVALDVAVLSAKRDGENAPAVQTAVTETASGIDGLSAEDAEAAAMFGLSASDWKKYNKESK